jgi:hypothetical protein
VVTATAFQEAESSAPGDGLKGTTGSAEITAGGVGVVAASGKVELEASAAQIGLGRDEVALEQSATAILAARSVEISHNAVGVLFARHVDARNVRVVLSLRPRSPSAPPPGRCCACSVGGVADARNVTNHAGLADGYVGVTRRSVLRPS